MIFSEQVPEAYGKGMKKRRNVMTLRWWLHDPGLPGWNFNPSTWPDFTPRLQVEIKFHPGKAGQFSTWHLLGGDYMIPVGQNEILSRFLGIPAVLQILHKLYLTITCIVKPVYSGHLRDWSNVSAIDRCPLHRFDKKPVKISAKSNITHSSLSIFIQRGIKDSFLLIKT